MARLYANEVAGLGTIPTSKSNGAVVQARLRRFRATITLASQATTDDILLARLPAGHKFAFGVITSSVSLGTSTVAIGVAGTTGKYRAAATNTGVNAPAMFGTAAGASGDPLEADEDVIATIAVAALPSSGTLVIDIYASAP